MYFKRTNFLNELVRISWCRGTFSISILDTHHHLSGRDDMVHRGGCSSECNLELAILTCTAFKLELSYLFLCASAKFLRPIIRIRDSINMHLL